MEAASKEKRSGVTLGQAAAAVVACVMISLGAYSILSSHYFGYTDKLGGAEVTLAGGDAQIMGWLYILLGLMPLAVWFRTARAAVIWASSCAGALLVVLATWLYG